MTENEAKAIRFIENIKNHAVVTLDHIVKEEPNVSPLIYKGREEKADTILTMIEELEQYRAIGTPEECLRNKDFLDFISDKMNPNDFETYLRLYNALEEKGCEE
nr:MAG TPA: hypothetical protein [Caudoviricetes sp.]